jgi:hypothetical protein
VGVRLIAVQNTQILLEDLASLIDLHRVSQNDSDALSLKSC